MKILVHVLCFSRSQALGRRPYLCPYYRVTYFIQKCSYQLRLPPEAYSASSSFTPSPCVRLLTVNIYLFVCRPLEEYKVGLALWFYFVFSEERKGSTTFCPIKSFLGVVCICLIMDWASSLSLSHVLCLLSSWNIVTEPSRTQVIQSVGSLPRNQ